MTIHYIFIKKLFYKTYLQTIYKLYTCWVFKGIFLKRKFSKIKESLKEGILIKEWFEN